MSFIAALATAGTAIASGAAAVGGTLAAGAGAIGSGLAAGAGALGSGIGALGSAIGSGAGALGSTLGVGAAEGAAAGAAGAGAAGAGGAGFAGLAGGTGLTAGAGAGGLGSLGAAGSSALGGSLTAGSMGLTGGGAAGLTGAAGSTAGLGAAAAPGLGAAMGATGAGSALPMAASMGGSGLAAPSMLGSIGEFASAHPILTSTGVGALGGAITNPNDPMKGALQGGAAGAIGGWGAGQLGGMAGAGGTLGKIGQFAAENPGITSAGIGILASPVIGGIIPNFSSSEQDKLNATNEQDRANFLRYMRQYRPSLAPGYAAGGITDLDGYMSNAQNIPNSQNLGLAQGGVGTQNIPNQNEVADPEGYGSNSTTMMAGGGIADLGGYSKGGNLLAGPGDGVSDDIPATIAGKQPARLASGEYIIPSRIVSELGNGSTDAGAKRLDMMVQKVNAGRAKTLGGKQYAKDTRAYKHLPV